MSCHGKSANSFFLPGDFCRTPGGLQQISNPQNSASTTPSSSKGDPGGVGFVDEIGGRVNGFISCTESLGFESSDERTTDDGSSIDELEGGHGAKMADSVTSRRARERSAKKTRRVEFPPPLTSLDMYGQRSFVLRPVRRDGRLEITEVRIQRPQVLFASRQNGRLTLRLIGDQEEEEEERMEEIAGDDLTVEDGEELEVAEGEEGEEGDGHGGGWRPAVDGGDEGKSQRRCYDYEVARHHHPLQVWSPRCVTTR